MRKRLIIIIWCIIIGTGAEAQLKLYPFSTDPMLFLEEMRELLESSGIDDYRKSSKEFVNTFPLMSIDQQNALIILANKMQAKRYTANPHFGDLSIAAVEIFNTSIESEKLSNYLTVLDSLLTRRADFKTFHSIFIGFLKEGLLYKSNTLKWQIDAPYELHFEEDQPVIKLKKTHLFMNFVKDSMAVLNTSGKYYPLRTAWEGKGGKVDWMRLGLRNDSLYCELNEYNVNCKQAVLKCPSATLLIPNKALKLEGSFEDRGQNISNPDLASYPRFIASETNVSIENIFANVDFRGKFRIEGRNYYCYSDERADAHIGIIDRSTNTDVQLRSKSFKINSSGLTGEHVSFVLRYGSDSVFHRDVTLRYFNQNRRLEAIRPPNAGSSFFDTKHNLDILCDKLSYALDSNFASYSMLPGKANSTALFLSENNYNQAEYDALRGIASYHPLVKLLQYYRDDALGSRVFSSDGYASTLGLQLDETRNLLIEMAQKGFIYYNRDLEQITLKEKTLNYIKANAGLIDYDVIRIRSNVANGQSNGKLDLKEGLLDLEGVRYVLLSDSHQVAVYPRSEKIRLNGGLNFELSGKVIAGPLEFSGSGINFDYSSFSLDMADVDSLKFRIFSGRYDKNNKRIFSYVRSALEDIDGVLKIDSFDNKSGRVKYYDYPKFATKAESYIFYEFDDIRNKAYPKDEFYFTVYPFDLDSLDYITLSRGIEFDGKLISAGIFPDFEETVRLQSDTTFGFVTTTPGTGYDLFGGKGLYKDTISLSSNGLVGKGELNYLEAGMKSEGFVFTPDSVFALVDKFEIEEGIFREAEYPHVKGLNLGMFWKPNADSMTLSQKEEAFELFTAAEVKFDGNIFYTPFAASGNGELSFRKHLIGSRSMVFGSNSLRADSSWFRIASDKEAFLAIKADSVKADIDFALGRGIFMPAKDTLGILMPFNELRVYLDRVFWNIRQRSFRIGSGVDSSIVRFETTNAIRRGLAFESSYANYDLLDYEIDAFGVKGIEVADAIIIPGDRRLLVARGSEISALEGAEILIGSDSTKAFYHRIVNADVEIRHGKSFRGSGDYVYTSLHPKHQLLALNSIYVTDSAVTKASGQIEDYSMGMNPGFAFQGAISLLGDHPLPQLKGYAKLDLIPDKIYSRPFRFSGEIDPFSPSIEQEVFLAVDSDTLKAGIYYDAYSRQPYSLVMSKLFNREDHTYIEFEKTITFDIDSAYYVIGENGNADSVKHMIVRTDKLEPTIRTKGIVDLNNGIDYLNLKAGGIIDYYLDTTRIEMKLATIIDQPFPESLSEMLENTIYDYTFSGKDINYKRPETLKNLAYVLSWDEYIISVDELKLYGALPSQVLNQSWLILPELNLHYNEKLRSFHTTDGLAVGGFNGEAINKWIPGGLEFIGSLEDVEMNMLMVPDKEFFYYFEYKIPMLEASASDIEFNDDLVKLLKKKKTIKKLGYLLSLGAIGNRSGFLKRIGGKYQPL